MFHKFATVNMTPVPYRCRHLLIALIVALCLTVSQLAVAAHGVVHPWGYGGAPHPGEQSPLPDSPACDLCAACAIGSAPPVSHSLHLDISATHVATIAPALPGIAAVICPYCSRAPPVLV